MTTQTAGPHYRHRRIGLLGGSFNPAHNGHRDMSLFAIKRLKLHEVWWLVSPQNPLKPTKNMAPFDERITHAIHIARHPHIKVTAIEASLKTHYTVDTIRMLRQRFPATHFVWIMGADNLRQLPRWRQWPAIMQHVSVAIFRRPAYAIGRKMGKAALRFDHAWQPHSAAKGLVRRSPPAWTIVNNRLNPLSATELRQKKRVKT